METAAARERKGGRGEWRRGQRGKEIEGRQELGGKKRKKEKGKTMKREQTWGLIRGVERTEDVRLEGWQGGKGACKEGRRSCRTRRKNKHVVREFEERE